VETVARGADAVADVVAGAQEAILACDAVHDDHLASLAAGAERSGREVVYVGSAGLAGAVELPGATTGRTADDGEAEQESEPEPEPESASSGTARVLGIAGSASPVTVEQLAAVPERRVVPLDVERAAVDPGAAAQDAAERALETLEAVGTALVASVPEESDVDRALRAGREAGLAPEAVRERIAESLALVAASAWEHDPPDGLFVTGGSVAGRVFDALGVTGVRLTGEAVEAGVPIGRALDGVAAGTRVVTKAGPFGDERTIVNCLDRLEGTDGT
jgi:uncharacterized protein YgbK (DUF1537 family)